jgi:hypothetical protein
MKKILVAAFAISTVIAYASSTGNDTPKQKNNYKCSMGAAVYDTVPKKDRKRKNPSDTSRRMPTDTGHRMPMDTIR